MKITVEVRSLRAALLKASRAVEGRSTIPILSTFHLQAIDGAFVVTTTNLDIEIEAKVPATVSQLGSFCIGRSFWKLIATLPAWDAITLTTSGERLVVDMPDGRASFIGFPASDFPFMKVNGEKQTWTMNSTAMLDGFKRISAFIRFEETRYYLNGVFLEAVRGKLSFVATDGHRLGKMTVDADWPDMSVIYPRQTVALFLKTFGRDEPLTVEYTAKKYLTFKGANVRLTSKLIDGKFPEYGRVIPAADTAKATVELSPSAWIGKLARLSIFSARNMNGALVKIGDRITASVASHDNGEMIVALGGKREGAKGEFGANMVYLRSILAAHSSDVRLRLIDEGSPVVFESEGVTTVLMPYRNLTSKLELPEGCEP